MNEIKSSKQAFCEVARLNTRKAESRFRARIVVLGMCIAANALFEACGNRQEYSYATLTDAVKAGEINRGWIPDYLPASSHAIHIVYDPSSPRTWCAFEFSPTDSQSLKKNLKGVNTLPQRVKRVDGLSASWWPNFLKGDLDVAKFHENGFDAYVTEEPDVQSNTDLVLFAIDWAEGRAFFYRTPGGQKLYGSTEERQFSVCGFRLDGHKTTCIRIVVCPIFTKTAVTDQSAEAISPGDCKNVPNGCCNDRNRHHRRLVLTDLPIGICQSQGRSIWRSNMMPGNFFAPFTLHLLPGSPSTLVYEFAGGPV